MFKHQFKSQEHKEFLGGELILSEVIITEYSPNGKQKLREVAFREVDIPEIIKRLEDFNK